MWWIIGLIIFVVAGYITYRKVRRWYIRNYNAMFEGFYPRRKIQRLAERCDMIVKHSTKDLADYEKHVRKIEVLENENKIMDLRKLSSREKETYEQNKMWIEHYDAELKQRYQR